MPKIYEGQIATLVKLQKIETEAQKLQSFLNEIPVRIEILDERLEKFVRSVDDYLNIIIYLNK